MAKHSFLLKLFSSDATKSHDFSVYYQNMELKKHTQYEVALIKAQIWYSWYNISQEKQNNTLKYSKDGGSTFTNITIPNGMWSIDAISQLIKTQVEKDNGDPDQVLLEGNFSTLKVDITLGPNYQLDLTNSDFNQLIGFTKVIITQSQAGTGNVDITAGINSILVHSSIASGSYINGDASDIIYGFSPDQSPGNLLDIHPNVPIYLPLSIQNQITRINMRITDQNNNAINLNGENVSYLLHIREM
jgi:hypothetical protein